MFKKALDLDIDPEFDVYCSSHFISQPGMPLFFFIYYFYFILKFYINVCLKGN